MTPLAARLAKQLTLRPKDRSEFWRDNSEKLRESLYDVHCFEVTQALPMLVELPPRLNEMSEDAGSDFIGILAFLPAPKTWIEWKHPLGMRLALLLEQDGEAGDWAKVSIFFDEMAQHIGKISSKNDDCEFRGGAVFLPNKFLDAYRHVDPGEFFLAMVAMAHLWLVLINSPRIIGRKQVMPNRGLERSLLRSFGPGKFPLHAWSEIKLQVAKPVEIDDGEPHEAHLTGRRALHFCRAHLRVRLGRLEYVSSHWRGDAALGIKQSRYKLVA